MIRWVLIIFIMVIIISRWLPWLEKLGLGRLPGDVRFRFGGKTYSFPFASTILLSMVALVLGRFLK